MGQCSIHEFVPKHIVLVLMAMRLQEKIAPLTLGRSCCLIWERSCGGSIVTSSRTM